MNPEETKQKIFSFLKAHNLAVLSTIAGNALPQAAVVGYAVKPSLELFFGTYKSSRKYQNLRNNPRVALVVGWEQGKTVQYEGEAFELRDEALEQSKKFFLSQVPTVAKYVAETDERFFEVRPRWIRYSDISRDPWDVEELDFFQ